MKRPHMPRRVRAQADVRTHGLRGQRGGTPRPSDLTNHQGHWNAGAHGLPVEPAATKPREEAPSLAIRIRPEPPGGIPSERNSVLVDGDQPTDQSTSPKALEALRDLHRRDPLQRRAELSATHQLVQLLQVLLRTRH